MVDETVTITFKYLTTLYNAHNVGDLSSIKDGGRDCHDNKLIVVLYKIKMNILVQIRNLKQRNNQDFIK